MPHDKVISYDKPGSQICPRVLRIPNVRAFSEGQIGQFDRTKRATFEQATSEQQNLHKFPQVPTDVELHPGDVVQPDVFVVLNSHLDRLTPSRLIGTPDLVIEVASPSTAHHDLSEKLYTYARAEVPEYWIVNPDAQTVELLVWQSWGYSSLGLFASHTTLPSQVVPDFPISVGQFFS